MPSNFIDETGNTYGTLTVIEKTKDKNGRCAWRCICSEGNEKIVRGSDLRAGKITTCGVKGCKCRSGEHNGRFKNEIGNRYGFLTVLELGEPDLVNKKIRWRCKCDCGNIVDVVSAGLRNGTTRSCGCKTQELNSQKHQKDLTNQKFGKLTAMASTGTKDSGNNILWRCKCDCGTETFVSTTHLLSGNTKSCGCLLSWKEERIKQILEANGIKYKAQQTFNDLKSESNHHLRFDFAILNKESQVIGLIEYQGIQHFEPTFGKTVEEKNIKFLNNQKRDNLKVEYCTKNKIPLLILSAEHGLEKEINNFLILIKGE